MNIIEEFDILLNTINLVLKDEHYKESTTYLNNFSLLLKEWKEDYIKANSLLNIDPRKLTNFKYETSDFFERHESYDIKYDNCYTEILSFHYNELLKYWKKEYLGLN